jgi:hypothetical protein
VVQESALEDSCCRLADQLEARARHYAAMLPTLRLRVVEAELDVAAARRAIGACREWAQELRGGQLPQRRGVTPIEFLRARQEIEAREAQGLRP